MASRLGQILATLVWYATPDTLPPPDSETHSPAIGLKTFIWLFSLDTLPRDPVVETRRGGWLKWMFTADVLPNGTPSRPAPPPPQDRNMT